MGPQSASSLTELGMTILIFEQLFTDTKSNYYFLPAASTLFVGSAPCQVTSAVGP
jgi:hypothetical protein